MAGLLRAAGALPRAVTKRHKGIGEEELDAPGAFPAVGRSAPPAIQRPQLCPALRRAAPRHF
eukprot:gene8024-4452_t